MFPPDPFDTGLDHVLVMAMVILFWGYVIWLVLRLLGRKRPAMALLGPTGVGYAIRLLAMAAVTATGIGQGLRGGDEIEFVSVAHQIASASLGSPAWLPFGKHGLYEIVFALQLRFGEFTVTAMRVTDIGIDMLGVALIAVAVYDLAGARAARLTGWLLAFEPSSLFFSQVLHKEPFMMLATGLVVFGGTKTWNRLNLGGIMIMGAGGAVAVATRPYAGWFLIAAAVFLTMHAALRNLEQTGKSIPMLLAVVGVIVVAVPVVLHKTTTQSLKALQGSQTANAQAAGTAGNNLALEQVNFSTRTAIITNLPRRIGDLLLRPWPWQIGDASQRLGVIGTLVAYAAMALLVLYGWRWRRHAFGLAAPLIYPLFFLLIAYSLSVGNAGTGFRYRSQLVVLMLATVVVLRERWLARATAPVRVRWSSPELMPRPARTRSGVGATVSASALGGDFRGSGQRA
jgi:hypothetical protein